ncbi:MAG TPA: prolipoprotein diacylglyceryl transferase family protein [Puia sp.]|jgi:prolipoprotein diacylglyceryltransferase|nr:prolipoprotein diacylglyceryl transferase family protein [Puia sp.]
MYPNLYYAFSDLFGWAPHWLQFINSFGFFVALSFIAAAVVLTKELIRKEREGLLQSREELVLIGKPASPVELILNFILGFILGFKLVGLFLTGPDPNFKVQDYILSGQGNWVAGLALGVLFAGLKWWEKNKQKLPQPQEKTIRIWPHDRVGDLTIFAFIFGFVGAKIFNSFETWDDFVRDPMGSLFSFSGLTFYGGLICAALAIWWYARKHGIGFWQLNDAAAPGLMLAYAIGRIGCQVAGDGDWGILNSAYITDPRTGKAILAQPGDFERITHIYQTIYAPEFKGLENIPHLAVKAPGFLPNWLFAYSYPHNVLGMGARLPLCEGEYCSQLPIPVFPTPVYETLMCLGLFFILWAIRKRLRTPGKLFGIYLILNGIERFVIEHIRVNSKYDFLPGHPTQAEVISSALVLSGVAILWALNRRGRSPGQNISPGSNASSGANASSRANASPGAHASPGANEALTSAG